MSLWKKVFGAFGASVTENTASTPVPPAPAPASAPAPATTTAQEMTLPTDYAGLTEMAFNHVAALQTAHQGTWKMGEAEDVQVDLGSGVIIWHFADKQVSAPVELLGTWNPADETFLWGWDHPSAPEGSAVASQAVKDYADEHGIVELQTSKPACDFDGCWKVAATAALIGNLQGVYRMEAAPNGPWAYMGFGTVKMQQRA